MKNNDNISFQIRTTSNLIRRNLDNKMSKKGYDKPTGMQCYIISYLYDNADKDIFQRDIENEFSIRRSTATAILKLMEKNNLIIRRSIDGDARLKKLILTKDAANKQKDFRNEIDIIEENMKTGLSDNEIKELKRMLLIVKNNLERQE